MLSTKRSFQRICYLSFICSKFWIIRIDTVMLNALHFNRRNYVIVSIQYLEIKQWVCPIRSL